MVEQPKKTLTFCAMQYGIYMGVYLFMTFLFRYGVDMLLYSIRWVPFCS